MESPYADLPEIPADFEGKLKLLKEQLDIFLGTVNEALEGPLREGDSPELQMLKGSAKDLGELAPAMLTAFAEVREIHLEVAREGLKAAEDFPERLRAMDEQLAKDLAPYAAENFIPKPPEPVPSFLDVLDIRQALLEAGELLRGDSPEEIRDPVPRTTGNIWEDPKKTPDKSRSGEKQRFLNTSSPSAFFSRWGWSWNRKNPPRRAAIFGTNGDFKLEDKKFRLVSMHYWFFA